MYTFLSSKSELFTPMPLWKWIAEYSKTTNRIINTQMETSNYLNKTIINSVLQPYTASSTEDKYVTYHVHWICIWVHIEWCIPLTIYTRPFFLRKEHKQTTVLAFRYTNES